MLCKPQATAFEVFKIAVFYNVYKNISETIKNL